MRKTLRPWIAGSAGLALLTTPGVVRGARAAGTDAEPPHSYRLNVSGADGVDGEEGADRGGTPGRNTDGATGGNAGAAKRGHDSGHINAKLGAETDQHGRIKKRRVTIHVDYTQPEQTAQISNDAAIHWSPEGRVQLVLNGGRAGAGGRGGQGQKGGKGSDGTDFSDYHGSGSPSYRSPTAGGSGASGGDGGNPTSAERAGLGGHGTVEVDAGKEGLLLLVDSAYSGGAGASAGAQGKGGHGGDGGDGGRGGTAYYTVTRERTVDDGTDSDGNSKSHTETYTTEESYSVSDASDGSTGSAGSDSNATVHGVDAGESGSFRYLVKQPDGSTKSYTELYHPRVVSFDVETDQDLRYQGDGRLFFEPGEHVTIKNIVVQNTSRDMPTPPNQKVRVHLGETAELRRRAHAGNVDAATREGWDKLLAKGLEIEIPKSIGPGESYPLAGRELRYEVKTPLLLGPRTGNGGRYLIQDTASAKTLLTDPRVGFSGSAASQTFDITHPIMIEPMTENGTFRMSHSLRPGTQTKVQWRIKNITDTEFTSDVVEAIAAAARARTQGAKRLGRAMNSTLELQQTGDDALDPKFVKFFDENGKEVDFAGQGFLRKLQGLKPGASQVVEGYVGVTHDAPAYKAVNLRATLNVGAIYPDAQGARAMRPMQMQDAQIRVSEAYHVNPGSSFLVVTNNRVGENEVNAYRKVAADYETAVSFYDVTNNGAFDMASPARASKQGHGINLFEDWNGKTVVVINDSFDPTGGKKGKAVDYLKDVDFQVAAGDWDTNFAILGARENVDGSRMMLATQSENRKSGSFKKKSELLAELKERNDEIFPHGRAEDLPAVNEEFMLGHYEMDIHGQSLFVDPKAEVSQKRAVALLEELELKYPTQKFVVVHRFQHDGTSAFFIKRWKGTLEVRRAPDPSTGSLLITELQAGELHSAEHILSENNRQMIADSFTFDQKMDLFKKTLEKSSELREAPLDEGLAKGAQAARDAAADAKLVHARRLKRAILTDIAKEQLELRKVGANYGFSNEKVTNEMVKLRALSDRFGGQAMVGTPEGDMLVDLSAELHSLMDSQLPWWDKWFPLGRRNARVTGVSNQMVDKFSKRVLIATPAENAATPEVRVQAARKKLNAEVKEAAKRSKASRENLAAKRAIAGKGEARTAESDAEFRHAEKDRVLTGSNFDAKKAKNVERDQQIDQTVQRNISEEIDLVSPIGVCARREVAAAVAEVGASHSALAAVAEAGVATVKVTGH